VRRPLDLEHRVRHLPPERRQLLLQLGLVVHEGGGRVVDATAERLDDRLLDPLERVLEEERRERRLEQRREDVPVPGETVELLRRDDPPPFLDQPLAEPELAGDDGTARTRDDVRADLREPPLRQVGIPVVQCARDGQLEDAVAQELEAFVRRGAVRRPRGMRERVVRPLGGQLVDQPREPRRLALRLATGAT
jgi:hypothetical protein